MIGVVIGALILGGLYALFATVIFPRMNEEVGGMMDYGEDGAVVQRVLDDQTGTYVLQYSYDGKHWQGVQMPDYGDGASVYQMIDGGALALIPPHQTLGGADIKLSTALAFLLSGWKSVVAYTLGLLLAVVVVSI